MPKSDFSVSRKEYDTGYSVHVLYGGKGISRMEHYKDMLGDFVINYNILIPSPNSIADNVKWVMDFLELLRVKQTRSREDALKDAGQYYGTIFGRQAVIPSAFGYRTPGEAGISIPFYQKEIEKEVAQNKLNSITMRTKNGAVSIEVCGNRDFSHHKIDFQPVTEVRFDGYAWDIAGELKDLALEVGCVQEPDFLKEPLEEMLGYFRETVQALHKI